MGKGKGPNPMETMLRGGQGGERVLTAAERREQRKQEREAAQTEGGDERESRSSVRSAASSAIAGRTDHDADDRTLKWVDPSLISIWEHHDRVYTRLTAEDCADILATLGEGQRVPVIVRPAADSSDYRYELVAGARRHWSASYLKRALLVEVNDEVGDKEAFELNQVDNLARQDVAPVERARTYAWAEQFYDSHVLMAEALGIDRKVLQRHLALAKLPSEVFEAYGDERAVPSAHAEPLSKLIERHGSEAVTRVARELNKEYREAGRFPRASGVLSQFKKAFEERAPSHGSRVVEHDGKKLVEGRQKSARQVQLDLYLDTGASADEIREHLDALIKDFLPQ